MHGQWHWEAWTALLRSAITLRSPSFPLASFCSWLSPGRPSNRWVMLGATSVGLRGTTANLTTGRLVLASDVTTKISSPLENSRLWPISARTNQALSGVPEHMAEKSGTKSSLVRPAATHEEYRCRLE